MRYIILILLVILTQSAYRTNDLILSTIETYHEMPSIEVKPIETDTLVNALIHVESRGNELAYNEPEDAVGCLQIRRIMVREVNRILRIQNQTARYKYKDRWDCNKSKEMFDIWKAYHHPDDTAEHVARNWNGGPKGYKRASTKQYWKKVQKYFEIES